MSIGNIAKTLIDLDMTSRLNAIVVTQVTQGLTGRPGDGATSRVLRTDYADARYAYLGYADQICRIDYSQFPALPQYAAISDLDDSWDDRITLNYT